MRFNGDYTLQVILRIYEKKKKLIDSLSDGP